MAGIDPELLGILRCPIARVPLVQEGDWLYSMDMNAPRRYPIRDGIPVLLIEEAQDVERMELERVLARARRGRSPQT
ncbi:MAG TPA: Trm112 family protein [Phycisphaerae bacterium]|nr:Trm112 family protein [Phycisphaerae bacterium]HNU46281.1 Trm112 family protein [Phycisphaerae bacterium]